MMLFFFSFFCRVPWEPLWTILLSYPCVHTHTHTHYCPPTPQSHHFLHCSHTCAALLLSSDIQCLTIIWRSHFIWWFFTLTKESHIRIIGWSIPFLYSSFIFFSVSRRTFIKTFWEHFKPHYSCMQTTSAQERCHLYFLTTKISCALESRSLMPLQLHPVPPPRAWG